MKRALLLTILFGLLVFSCNKDEDTDPKPEPLDITLLTDKIWKTTEIDGEPAKACRLDDTLDFLTDSTFLYWTKDVPCVTPEFCPVSKWKLYDNDSKIIFDFIFVYDTATIIKIDKETLILDYQKQRTFTYKH